MYLKFKCVHTYIISNTQGLEGALGPLWSKWLLNSSSCLLCCSVLFTHLSVHTFFILVGWLVFFFTYGNHQPLADGPFLWDMVCNWFPRETKRERRQKEKEHERESIKMKGRWEGERSEEGRIKRACACFDFTVGMCFYGPQCIARCQ